MSCFVRVVGRFQPAGVFQCLKVRKAAEDDLQYLKTKLGLLDQNRKVELLSYGLNGSLNSSVARGTSCLSGLDTLCRAPIVANPFLAATGEGDP